jgi:hypothetical protein
MTTDPDRTARTEFDAAAYLIYAKEHTMREYCPHCHRELCPSEGRIFAGICIDCFLADKAPAPRDEEMLAGHRAEDMTNGGIEPDWCPCGAPIPETGDFCHDCAQEHVPEEVKAMQPARTCHICGDVNVMQHEDICVSCHRTHHPGALDRLANAGARRLGAMLLALALSLTTHTAHAADTLTYESQHGRGTLTLPYIGTPAYSDSCTITHAWEDHSAIAYCTEDGATYHFDPDGDITSGKAPGWYAD